MVYLAVMITSGAGILAIIVIRSVLRSRNVRRIARSVKHGFSSVEKRNAKLLPDTPVEKVKKSPRTCAIELQQVRTLLRQAEKDMAKQDSKSAEKALIQALMIDPNASEVKAELAAVYLETCREAKAEAIYRDLLHTIEDPALYGNLGLSCYKQEKYVDACKAYQAALNLEPRNPGRSYDLGRACVAAQHFDEAAPLLEKAAKSLTRDIGLLHLLAQCYIQISDADRAEETYRRINRLDPRDEEVKQKIAQFAQVA